MGTLQLEIQPGPSGTVSQMTSAQRPEAQRQAAWSEVLPPVAPKLLAYVLQDPQHRSHR